MLFAILKPVALVAPLAGYAALALVHRQDGWIVLCYATILVGEFLRMTFDHRDSRE